MVSNWKQPIMYGYDTPMTQDLLHQIIEQLHNVGFNVIAMVSDMGSSNIGLWKAVNISIENTTFKHKITNQNIHVFADVPHLLKLARNHLVDKYKTNF